MKEGVDMSLTRLLLLALSFLLSTLPIPADEMNARQLLDSSIAHHDPEGLWTSFDHTLVFRESRPDGSARESRVAIDLLGGRFVHDLKTDEVHVVRRVENDRCSGSLDGSTDYSPEQADKNRLTCDQIKRYRDYYTYLWGLPMKLEDPGTRLAPGVSRTSFVGKEVLSIKVTYDPEVGGDTWTFYFDPESHALVGYRFYHDVSKNDGEYIVLDGTYTLGTMRIPKSRTWYVNADDRLLGTDELVNHE